MSQAHLELLQTIPGQHKGSDGVLEPESHPVLGTTPSLPRHRGDEGLRLLHGLEANLATSLQTPQEA